MSLTTTTRVKATLGIPAGVTFHDTSLGYAVDGANKYVLTKLGQSSLAVMTTTEYPEVYGEGQARVMLKHTPVVSVVGVTNGASAIASSDYMVDLELGAIDLLAETNFWSTRRKGVAVMYAWGYDANTVPGELVRAADLIAVASFNRARHAGLVSESESGYRYDLDENMVPAEARAILANYVRFL